MRLFKNSYILYFFFGGEGVLGGAPYNGLGIKKIYIYMNSDNNNDNKNWRKIANP